ncbi:unnamed protein product [Microthlaspi erraticum]|uniref:Uncharacterized protein n=1 Tax=Microthlaspi erraticum TaxID=1685480 RepID=A0A6D2JAC0_9BRAS|nr:unnamed protein product [Microthlaspi erraticum]
MVPWYQGFKGTITAVKSESESELGGTRYLTEGKLQFVNDNTHIIRELPIKRNIRMSKLRSAKLGDIVVTLGKGKRPKTDEDCFKEKHELKLTKALVVSCKENGSIGQQWPA